MAYSVNTTPLLKECNSDDEENQLQEDTISLNDTKALFKSSEPRDKYYVVYIIFYLLGLVTLLPWNFFITADDYWMFKFRDVNQNVTNNSSGKRTPLQAEFTSYISVASAIPTLIFLILNTAISHRVTLNTRVIWSLVVMLLLFLSTLVFIHIDTDKWQHGFFLITLGTIVLLNVCSAILSGSIFGICGKFSPIYITATLGGQALGGIFAALAEIVSLAIGASSTHSAFVYFTIGNLTIILAIIFYIILTKSVFFKYHIIEKSIVESSDNGISERSVQQTFSYKIVLRKIWCYGLSMFSVFAITLSVYPGVTVLIESQDKGHGNKWHDVYFVPTIAYLLFSVGDYLGRIIAGRIQKPKNEILLIILSLSRFMFIPLLMLCNAQPRHYSAVVFNQDYQYILILFMCALSNGYLANICAIFTPKVVDEYEKEIASSMMTVFMGVGLAFGSTLSLVMVKLL